MYDRDKYIEAPHELEGELKIIFDSITPKIIFEIGACEGEDSVKYSRMFPGSDIYSFEPLPDNIDRLRDNLRKYHVSNVKNFQLALSDKIGETEFYVSSSTFSKPEQNWDYGNKSSSLMPPKEHLEIVDFIKFDKRIEVATTTLAEFCMVNGIRKIDYIHLDVQGAELLVLKGSQDFIKYVGAIWLEVSRKELYAKQPLYDEVVQFMTLNNFFLVKDTVNEITGDQLYLNRSIHPDYLAIKKKIYKAGRPRKGIVLSIKAYLKRWLQ